MEGAGWERMRHRVLQEEPNCRKCGQSSTDVDHIIPLSKGGSSERINLQALCRSCHRAKSLAVYSLPRRSDLMARARGFRSMYFGLNLTKAGRYRNPGRSAVAVERPEVIEFFGMHVPSNSVRHLETRMDIEVRAIKAGYRLGKRYRRRRR